MKHPGPLFTLLAGVVLAAGIAVANVAGGSTGTLAGKASAQSTAATPAPESSSAAEAPTAPVRADYAGHVDGGGASVAVSVREGNAIAYVCDGDATEAWLRGNAAGGRLDLNDSDGGSLSGVFDPANATGTITVGAKTWHFTAGLSKKPAGLYRATPTVQGQSTRVGWIVQPDGSQVGIITTAGGRSAPAPALDPAAGTATVGGSPVAAETISGLTGNGDF
jgi:serine/threonine-protein kinase